MAVCNCYKAPFMLPLCCTCPCMLNYVHNCYKTQEKCAKAVSKELFMLKYCLHECKSQEIYDEAVDAFLSLLIFF